MLLIGEYKYRTVPSFFDRYRRIRPFAIFDMAQQAASSHAYSLGFGYDAMMEKGLIWIVARNKFVIEREMTSTQYLNVKTWPHKSGRFDAQRDFFIMDENNEVCVRGSSLWCLYDLKTNRIAPMSNAVFVGEFNDESSFPSKLEKIRIEDDDTFEVCLEHKVTPSDLDWNHHMNNARYSELVYDAMNSSEDEIIYSMEIDYLSQAREGEVIEVKKSRHDKEITLIGSKGDAVCFIAKCVIR